MIATTKYPRTQADIDAEEEADADWKRRSHARQAEYIKKLADWFAMIPKEPK